MMGSYRVGGVPLYPSLIHCCLINKHLSYYQLVILLSPPPPSPPLYQQCVSAFFSAIYSTYPNKELQISPENHQKLTV